MERLQFFRKGLLWVNKSIQRKLLFWSIGFWVVSISALSLITLWVGQNEITVETRQRNVRLASIISRDINSRISDINSDIRTFVRHLEQSGPDLKSQAEAVLALRLSSPQRYRSVFYFDAGGNPVFHLTEPLQGLFSLQPDDIVGRPPINPDKAVADTARMVAGSHIYVSEVQFSSLDHSPVFYSGARIDFGNGDSRVVVLELDLHDIWQRIALSTMGETGFTYAVSRDGKIITHKDPAVIGTAIPPEIVPVTQGYEGFTEYLEPLGKRPVFAAYSPVGGPTGWGIIVEQEKSEAQAPVFRTGLLIGGVWLVLAIIGTVSILILIRNFTGPIIQLTRTTQAVTHTGDLAKTGMEQRPDEVGQLSQAFDQMVERLQTNESKVATAAADERNRLARDLHDAVSQTLFSASIIAEVLPRLWARNPEEGKKRLEEIRQLTRGALAEMRTLLLELRPSALVETEIGHLLKQLAESISGRSRIPVTVTLEGETPLPVEVKVAFYRITQEALNNVAKHSGAKQAKVTLVCRPERFILGISDDGRGFVVEENSAKSLGLGIIRERAREIGATLTLQSEPGSGTEITVTWENPHQKA